MENRWYWIGRNEVDSKFLKNSAFVRMRVPEETRRKPCRAEDQVYEVKEGRVNETTGGTESRKNKCLPRDFAFDYLLPLAAAVLASIKRIITRERVSCDPLKEPEKQILKRGKGKTNRRENAAQVVGWIRDPGLRGEKVGFLKGREKTGGREEKSFRVGGVGPTFCEESLLSQPQCGVPTLWRETLVKFFPGVLRLELASREPAAKVNFWWGRSSSMAKNTFSCQVDIPSVARRTR